MEVGRQKTYFQKESQIFFPKKNLNGHTTYTVFVLLTDSLGIKIRENNFFRRILKEENRGGAKYAPVNVV